MDGGNFKQIYPYYLLPVTIINFNKKLHIVNTHIIYKANGRSIERSGSVEAKKKLNQSDKEMK